MVVAPGRSRLLRPVSKYDVKGACGFLAVGKKRPPDLPPEAPSPRRKILPVKEANYWFGPAPYARGMGLWGPAIFPGVWIEGDRLEMGTVDQKNAFTYVFAPLWMHVYHCLPPVRRWELPPDLRGVGFDNDLVYLAYMPLPMGGTHSAGILVAINLRRVGNLLVASARLHSDLLWKDTDASMMMERPWAWELGFGDGRWSRAMFEMGFLVFRPAVTSQSCVSPFCCQLFKERFGIIAKSGLLRVVLAVFRRWPLQGAAKSDEPVSSTNICKFLSVDIEKRDHCLAALLGTAEANGAVILGVAPTERGTAELAAPSSYTATHVEWRRPGWKRAGATGVFGNRQWLSRIRPRRYGDKFETCFGELWTQNEPAESSLSKKSKEEEQASPAEGLMALSGKPMLGRGYVLHGRRGAFYDHIDDGLAFGGGKFRAAVMIKKVSENLSEAGFLLDEPCLGASPTMKYIGLGFTRHPAGVHFPAVTDALMYTVCTQVLGMNYAATDLVHKIVGVHQWGAQIRRALMSVTGHVHKWLRTFEDQKWGPLWPSVKSDIRAIRGFLPAVYCDLHAGALPWVACQDAEGESKQGLGGWGMGLCFPKQDELLDLVYRAPAKGLSVDVRGLIAAVPDQPGEATTVPVSRKPDSWDHEVWHDLGAGTHNFREHVNLYEGRVSLKWLYVLLKIPQSARSRLLDLGDNLVSVAAFIKGRSPSWSLRRLCQRRLALEVSGSTSLVPAWEPTLRMQMDALSRERVVRRTCVATLA